MTNNRRRMLAALALTAGLLTTGAAVTDIIATPLGDTAWGAPAGEDHDPTVTTGTDDTGTITTTPLDTAWG